MLWLRKFLKGSVPKNMSEGGNDAVINCSGLVSHLWPPGPVLLTVIDVYDSVPVLTGNMCFCFEWRNFLLGYSYSTPDAMSETNQDLRSTLIRSKTLAFQWLFWMTWSITGSGWFKKRYRMFYHLLTQRKTRSKNCDLEGKFRKKTTECWTISLRIAVNWVGRFSKPSRKIWIGLEPFRKSHHFYDNMA